MKRFLLLFLFSFFLMSGCTFLRGGAEDSLDEDYAVAEEEASEEEDYEEYVEEEEEEEEEEEIAEDEEEEEEEYAEEEEGEEDEEYAEDEEEEIEEEYAEEEEEEGESKGLFSWMFGSSDEDSEGEEEEASAEEAGFIGEDENFAEGDRDYEDYEEIEEEEYADEEEEEEEYVEAEEAEEAEEASRGGEIQAQAEEASDSKTESSPSDISAGIPTFTPLNKIISNPYQKAGFLVNAVYIARPGDDLESIAQKIYGSGQSEALRQINGHLQSRSVVVGDKIYYNSPSRPNDNSRLLFYYEDINVPSSVYRLSPGDNIRKVAFQLLGDPKSWKEIWATNPHLVSKGEITETVSITYWPQNLKQVSAPKTPQKAPPAPPEPEAPPLEEPELPSSSAENLPEEPALEGQISPPEEVFPSPPPSSPASATGPEFSPSSPFQLSDIWNRITKQGDVSITLIIIILILIIIIRIIMKKRSQRDFDYTATNIEI